MVRLSLIFYGIQKVDYYFPRLENHHGRLSIHKVEQLAGVERRAADRPCRSDSPGSPRSISFRSTSTPDQVSRGPQLAQFFPNVGS